MNDKLLDAFETCLQALEQGETVDSVLARFPALAAELRPMLEASLHARTLSGPGPSDEIRRRTRTRLLHHAAEMREAKRAPRRTWVYTLRPLAAALAVLVIFFSSTGLVRASSGALPGDGLYPVKRTWESMQLLFTFDEIEREDLELAHENERLHEIDELLAEGREEPVTFSGYVTAQDGDLWIVAGVTVRVSSQTRLPGQPVETGAGIKVTGRTDAQGFLVAQSVDILPAGTVIPPIDDDSYENENGEDEDEEEEDENSTRLETPVPFPALIGSETETPTSTVTVVETEIETETETETENETETETENEGKEEEETEEPETETETEN